MKLSLNFSPFGLQIPQDKVLYFQEARD